MARIIVVPTRRLRESTSGSAMSPITRITVLLPGRRETGVRQGGPSRSARIHSASSRAYCAPLVAAQLSRRMPDNRAARESELFGAREGRGSPAPNRRKPRLLFSRPQLTAARCFLDEKSRRDDRRAAAQSACVARSGTAYTRVGGPNEIEEVPTSADLRPNPPRPVEADFQDRHVFFSAPELFRFRGSARRSRSSCRRCA